MKPLSLSRYLYLLSALLAAVSLLFAIFFLQGYLGLPPCPLCILDRYIIAGLGILSLLAALAPGLARTPVLTCQGFLLLLGIIVSSRHVYLELAPASPGELSCLPSQSANNWLQVLTQAFSETGNCALITWEFLSLTLAQQTFLLFVFFLALWLGQLLISSKLP